MKLSKNNFSYYYTYLSSRAHIEYYILYFYIKNFFLPVCVEGDQSFSLFKTSYKPEKKDYMLALQREGHRNELLPFSELKNLYTMMGVAMKQIKPVHLYVAIN